VFGREPLRACGMGGAHLAAESPPGCDILDHYGLVLEYPDGGKVHHSHLSYAIPDRRFAGVYELVFGEKLGIDLANAIAWDRSGKTIELSTQGGNDTQLALESFLSCVRTGEQPAAGARVAYRATLASLLAMKALDSGQTVEWTAVASREATAVHSVSSPPVPPEGAVAFAPKGAGASSPSSPRGPVLS